MNREQHLLNAKMNASADRLARTIRFALATSFDDSSVRKDVERALNEYTESRDAFEKNRSETVENLLTDQ